MAERHSFSQRQGLKPLQKGLQLDSMDDDLRNGVWNALELVLWKELQRYAADRPVLNPRLKGDIFFELLWVHYFKRPLHTLHPNWQENLKRLRTEYFQWPWNEVYDFIEFTARHFPSDSTDDFRKGCNFILQREMSGYRFVGDSVVRITSGAEIAAIEQASSISGAFTPVGIHIDAALRLLADRKTPDYRNSIKESISAVESVCKILAADTKATLGTALNKLECKHGLHQALKNAFHSLYGYTSDEGGIRHALLDEPHLDFDDAKFMLVSCSAFVNYLISKTAKQSQ